MKVKQIVDVSVGSDFETFLFDKNKDQVINAKKYVKGTKEKPYNFDKSNEFWCTSLDNISMEGNIPPCTTSEDFSNNIQKVLDYMNSKLPEGLCTIHTPAVRVDRKQLRTNEARIFGCDKSYNAYTLKANPMPNCDTNLRTCCTHVHIKYKDMDVHTSAELIKAMDLFLGIPSLIIEPLNERRELYGKVGEFRYHPRKTTEYRVLSSFFSQSDSLRRWVFDNTIKSIDWVNAGGRVSDTLGAQFHNIMRVSDLQAVEGVIKEFNIPLPC